MSMILVLLLIDIAVNPSYICKQTEYMIKSMTGYGKGQADFPDKSVIVEIRSLNSKQMDINTRVSAIYREKDLEIRNLVSKALERGKVDLSLYVDQTGGNTNYSISEDIALNYFNGLKELESKLPGNKTDDYLSILTRLPEVVKTEKEELDEEEWNTILAMLESTIDAVDHYRIDEGQTLFNDVYSRAGKIKDLLDQTEPFEKDRINTIRERVSQQLSALEIKQVDQDRFEQEMIYYLEKLDISEERTRLAKHCEYFQQVLNEEKSQGKKLGFIAQEMGREINTLGSKASDATIQKLVVEMKDELEKIKEQLMNIL